jgi:hypothetical protein
MLNYQRVTLVNGRMIILRDFGEGASLEMGGSISRIWIFQVAGVGR